MTSELYCPHCWTVKQELVQVYVYTHDNIGPDTYKCPECKQVFGERYNRKSWSLLTMEQVKMTIEQAEEKLNRYTGWLDQEEMMYHLKMESYPAVYKWEDEEDGQGYYWLRQRFPLSVGS